MKFGIAATLVLLLTVTAESALLEFEGIVRPLGVTSGMSSQYQVNDHVTGFVEIDLSTPDVSSSPVVGVYNGAIGDFSFVTNGVTFTGGGSQATATVLNLTNDIFAISNNVAPAVSSGISPIDVDLVFDSSSDGLSTDELPIAFDGTSPFPGTYDGSSRLLLTYLVDGRNEFVNFAIISVQMTAVPEPSAFLLGAFIALGVAGRNRIRKWRQLLDS